MATLRPLHVRHPDGRFVVKGVTPDSPAYVRLPDGTFRRWPNAPAPLFQKMPDGSWQVALL